MTESADVMSSKSTEAEVPATAFAPDVPHVAGFLGSPGRVMRRVLLNGFRPMGLIVIACLSLTVGTATASAQGAPLPNCGHYANYTGSGIPVGSGIPPWGFHASQSFPGGGSAFAWGWGDVNLATSSISGRICEDIHGPKSTVTLKVGPRISYQSHYAVKWGYPGNLVKTSLKVTASTDPACAVGTLGHITMYASYNGVRTDSMRLSFAAGCGDQDHLYHGHVVAQVPPL
jgi:hypothetical protein